MSSPQPAKGTPNKGRPKTANRGGHGHRGLISVLVIAALVGGFVLFCSIWTDALWFSSVGFSEVFNRTIVTQILLGLAGFVIMGGIVSLSILVAYRLRPASSSSDSPILRQLRASFGRRVAWIVALPGVAVGAAAAASAAAQTQTFLAWSAAKPFGYKDPTFGLDASFFVFSYPWLRYVVSFVSTSLVMGLVAALIVHYVTGAINLQPSQSRSRLALGATRQLAVTAALILVCFGCDMLLDRVSYAVTTNQLLTGVTYTDAHSRVTARLVMAIIAFVCAAAFIVNIWLKRWMTAGAAVVLMLISGLVLSLIYPTVLQSLSVKPSEPDKEAPFMEAHINATRMAYGVQNVQIGEYAAASTATAGQLRSDAEALPGIRLMDPSVVSKTYDQLQQVRGYYTFPKVLDVDRYKLNGVTTDSVVAVREIDTNGIPNPTWNNLHTVYTHGFGLVAAYGNRRTAGGEPEWIARDIPPVGQLTQDQARIYFGELSRQFVIVGAKPGAAPIELDTPGSSGGQGGEQNTTYSGKGGVPLGNWLNRIAYSIKFADMNLLLSDRVHDNSQLLYVRTPADRVRTVAPWLTIDSDPYPTLVNGRVTWVVDAYTTSNFFPNSQRTSVTDATRDIQTMNSATGATDESINYIRNSVKATVDAYDGTVTLYAWDPTDPIVSTWRSVYPGLIKDRSAMPTELVEHLRYPEDLFKLQREILGRYHMTSPDQWYKNSDLWTIPIDPVAARQNNAKDAKESSYYLSIKWPGDDRPVFSQTTVFVPKGRANLAAFMAVNSDATSPDYGKLRVLRMSDSHQIDSPGQAFNAMTSDPKVAETLRPYLNQGTAAASYGNLLTIPLGGGLLFVTPVYTQREGQASSSYPVLRYVIVRFGSQVAIGSTLQEALDLVFQGNSGGQTQEQQTTGGINGPGADEARRALAEAQKAFEDADKALRAGDLATYQKKMAEAAAASERARRALG